MKIIIFILAILVAIAVLICLFWLLTLLIVDNRKLDRYDDGINDL